MSSILPQTITFILLNIPLSLLTSVSRCLYYLFKCIYDCPVEGSDTDTAELEVRRQGFGRTEYVRIPSVRQKGSVEESLLFVLYPFVEELQSIGLSTLNTVFSYQKVSSDRGDLLAKSRRKKPTFCGPGPPPDFANIYEKVGFFGCFSPIFRGLTSVVKDRQIPTFLTDI